MSFEQGGSAVVGCYGGTGDSFGFWSERKDISESE